MSERNDRLERAADRSELADLVARLALVGDVGDLDDYRQIFTAEGVWADPSGERDGIDAIVEGVSARRTEGHTGPGSGFRHVVSTLSITFPSTDAAVGDSYFIGLEDISAAPKIRVTGRYHDTFVRTPDGWRIARRDITVG
jgi:hypothetical protein